MQWWARSVIEDHVQMVDTESSEVCGRVEFGVQTDDESDVALGEVGENVLEGVWKVGLLDGGGVGRYGGI